MQMQHFAVNTYLMQMENGDWGAMVSTTRLALHRLRCHTFDF